VTTLHKTGKILGGYADQTWNGYSLPKASNKVFIFDLNTKKQYVPSQMNRSEYRDNTSGSGFGNSGSSFGIRENPALNSSISTNGLTVAAMKTRNAQYSFSPDSYFIEKGVKTSSVCFGVTFSNAQQEIANVDYVEVYQLEISGIAEVYKISRTHLEC